MSLTHLSHIEYPIVLASFCTTRKHSPSFLFWEMFLDLHIGWRFWSLLGSYSYDVPSWPASSYIAKPLRRLHRSSVTHRRINPLNPFLPEGSKNFQDEKYHESSQRGCVAVDRYITSLTVPLPQVLRVLV